MGLILDLDTIYGFGFSFGFGIGIVFDDCSLFGSSFLIHWLQICLDFEVVSVGYSMTWMVLLLLVGFSFLALVSVWIHLDGFCLLLNDMDALLSLASRLQFGFVVPFLVWQTLD